jgi:hypothetical protein
MGLRAPGAVDARERGGQGGGARAEEEGRELDDEFSVSVDCPSGYIILHNYYYYY